MSDKALSGDDLENLLLTWQKTYGTEQTNKGGNIYYKIADMRTALSALVNTFISIGYDEKDIRSILLASIIQRTVTPHRYEGKLTEWRLMIGKQWKDAINDYFPFVGLQEAKVNDRPKKPEVEIPKETITSAGVIIRSDGTTFKERPELDKSQIKGLVMPEYILVENDPLAFLRKDKK